MNRKQRGIKVLKYAAIKFCKNKRLTFFSFFKSFYNINLTTSLRIIKLIGVKINSKLYKSKINPVKFEVIKDIIQDKCYINHLDIKRDGLMRLYMVKTFKSLRHLENLPVRGQRTRTNGKTRRMRGVQ